MNERIKEIAEQAGSVYQKNLDVYLLLPDELEKFAELIVRECVQVLETNGDNQRTIRMTESIGHDRITDWMAGYEEAVKQYGGYLLKKNAKQIKKHFGVEE